MIDFHIDLAHCHADAYINGIIGIQTWSKTIVSTPIPLGVVEIGVGGRRRSLQNYDPEF